MAFSINLKFPSDLIVEIDIVDTTPLKIRIALVPYDSRSDIQGSKGLYTCHLNSLFL